MTNIALHNYPRIDADKYFTIEAPRLVGILDRHVGISGRVHEPAAGANHIADVVNDLPAVTGCYSSDLIPSTEFCDEVDIYDLQGDPSIDWVVTNLPYEGQPELMQHLLDIYPASKHAYLVKASFLQPKGRRDLIHCNPRFAGAIMISKRPKWFLGGGKSPAVDYAWILFGHEGFYSTPKLGFENGPAVSFFGGV